MALERKKLIEVIKVKIDANIELTIKSISEFKYWKSIFPHAEIVNYNIQAA